MNTVFYKKSLLTLLVFVGISLKMIAQRVEEGNFVYSDGSKTEIVGLTESGTGANELEIPATVTSVAENAFADAKTTDGGLTTLTIKGNPEFNADAFGSVGLSTLTKISIEGQMTIENMETLLISLKTRGSLDTIDIEKWETGWSYNNSGYTEVLTSRVNVVMPAAKVEPNGQVWGNANICGIFEVPNELATFCGKANFVDADNGSNFLFYGSTKFLKNTKEVYLERVNYILAGKGVVMRRRYAAEKVYLKRVGDELTLTADEATIQNNNMLVGVTEATAIARYDDENRTYTNMVLATDGLFHPAATTPQGKLKANRAYLKVLTEDYLYQVPQGGEEAKLRMTFSDDESTGIREVNNDVLQVDGNAGWYTLSGQRLSRRPLAKGMYIHDGRTVVVK